MRVIKIADELCQALKNPFNLKKFKLGSLVVP
jgi:hypothetical protein